MIKIWIRIAWQDLQDSGLGAKSADGDLSFELFGTQDGSLELSSGVVSTRCPPEVNDGLSDRKHHTQWDSYSEKFEIHPGWSLAALKRLDVHGKLKCLLSGMHRESGEWWLSYKLFLCSWKTVLHSCCAPWDNSEITVVPQPAINKVVIGFHHSNFPWILFFQKLCGLIEESSGRPLVFLCSWVCQVSETSSFTYKASGSQWVKFGEDMVLKKKHWISEPKEVLPLTFGASHSCFLPKPHSYYHSLAEMCV